MRMIGLAGTSNPLSSRPDERKPLRGWAKFAKIAVVFDRPEFVEILVVSPSFR